MKSAVLVIDVQKALFHSTPRPFEADEVVARINSLLGKARDTQTPVFFIQHEKTGSPLSFGEPGWALDPSLEFIEGDTVIRKKTPDSFLRTNLEQCLTEAGVNHLIVCGYATEFCIDTTIRRALGLGYHITLVSDAHTTQDKAHATGEIIRNHHNFTIPCLLSFGQQIKVLQAHEIEITG